MKKIWSVGGLREQLHGNAYGCKDHSFGFSWIHMFLQQSVPQGRSDSVFESLVYIRA